MRLSRERDGRVFCPFYPTTCKGSPYPDACLARAVSAHTFEQYNRVRIRLLEEQKMQELEGEMNSRIQTELNVLRELDEQRRKIRVACHHINEEILTCKCPRETCRQAFIDFEGCFALKCSRCSCGFCAWCFLDCGEDAHAHVRTCASKPQGADTYFGSVAEFQGAVQRHQRALLKVYFRTLDPSTQAAVKQEMHAQLCEILSDDTAIKT